MKAEDRLARLGECLQKTAPPVLVFAEKTRDVDMVHEYLLTRGVNAVAIHGAHQWFMVTPQQIDPIILGFLYPLVPS